MKNKILFILFLTLLINISYAKRTAMLVGVQNYKAFASLEACHGDVDAIKELLMQGGFEDDHIWVMKDAGYGEMLTASDLFSNVTAFARGIQKGDEVVFFFSGHGIGGSDGKNYLLGADGNIDNPEKYGSISVEEIKQILKENSPSEVVMIVDACRNFVKKEGKGTGEKISSKLNTGKGIKVSSTIGTEPVAQSAKSDKTIVKTIYAASEGQQSFERKDKNKGAFTYYMTYLNDSPNSALDIDMSKDGVITIEDLVQFADNRLGDYTKSQGLPSMNPVYQTEGGITYEPFKLFRYNAEQAVQEQKKEGAKPIFQYDEKAELEKIKKFTENKEYLKEELPVYQPKEAQNKTIIVDNTDLSSWKAAAAQEEQVRKAKAEEAEKEAEAKDKEQIYNELKAKYNKAIAELDKTEDIFIKHEKLESLRNDVNSVKYPEIKQKILVLLEPVYQKIKDAKGQKQNELNNLKIQFEKDIKDMAEMMSSALSDEFKAKYLEGFKNKWDEFAKYQTDKVLLKRYNRFFLKLDKEIKSSSTGLNLVLVPAGTIGMEVNKVSIENFYIGKTEVTQAQYKKIMGENPSYNRGGDKPVEQVTWYDAVDFCNKLSEKEGLEKCYSGSWDGTICNYDASGYRLPTELEWEYAARGGNKNSVYDFSGNVKIDEVAWYNDNSRTETHSTGTKPPNELGIYDMTGNVWEWCWDWYSDGSSRALRGGSYLASSDECSIGVSRKSDSPSLCDWSYGFRVVRVP